jgi:outer membrane protein OmpA-like peptidoglycan-associated protein
LLLSQTKNLKDTAFKIGDIIRIPDALNINQIRPDSAKMIADFLNSHKNISFELSAHTDIRGKAASNFTLSAARARSVRLNLISDYKVDSTQIKSKGYGSAKTIIQEKEIAAVKTVEEKERLHQINRRMELKVLTIH